MTIVQRVRIVQSAWTEWPDPPRATLRAMATVAGPAEELIDDICCVLAEKLDWGIYGVTIFPESTLPLDTPDAGEARLEIGSLVVMTDPNQGTPEFEDGSPEPAVSDVRFRLRAADQPGPGRPAGTAFAPAGDPAGAEPDLWADHVPPVCVPRPRGLEGRGLVYSGLGMMAVTGYQGGPAGAIEDRGDGYAW